MCEEGSEARESQGVGGEKGSPATTSRGAPAETALRRELKTARNELNQIRDRTVCEFFEMYATQLQKRSREGSTADFYKHMDGLDVQGKLSFTWQNIKYEGGKLLREPVLILARWARGHFSMF